MIIAYIPFSIARDEILCGVIYFAENRLKAQDHIATPEKILRRAIILAFILASQ